MPRGTTLSNLRSMLKAAIGDNSTGNTSRDAELNTLLSNEQRLLASSFDFPFLRHRWDITCAAGSRFLALPTTTSAVGDLGASLTIDFDRPVTVKVKFNSIWLPVSFGISEDDLTAFDSDLGVTSDPIRRWRMATNTSEASYANFVEIWPIPSTSQTLRFIGQRQLLSLTDDAHKADLDDALIVYSVAVKRAVRGNLVEEAKAQLASAKQREMQLRSSYPQEEEVMILGERVQGERRDERTGTFIGVAAGTFVQSIYGGDWSDPNNNIVPTTPSLTAFYIQSGVVTPNIWKWNTSSFVWDAVITP